MKSTPRARVSPRVYRRTRGNQQSRGNRVVFPRKRLLALLRRRFTSNGGGESDSGGDGGAGCSRGNREIRAGKTFEYKSSVGVFPAKRFIYNDVYIRTYTRAYLGGPEVKHVLYVWNNSPIRLFFPGKTNRKRRKLMLRD